jgi:hypothetical protein
MVTEENSPLLLVVTVVGLVTTRTPSNVIATGMLGAKPVPVISTEVPTGPELGLSEIVGERLELYMAYSYERIDNNDRMYYFSLFF